MILSASQSLDAKATQPEGSGNPMMPSAVHASWGAASTASQIPSKSESAPGIPKHAQLERMTS